MYHILEDLHLYGIHEGVVDTSLINEWDNKYLSDIEKKIYFKEAYNQYFKLINDSIPFFMNYNNIISEYYQCQTKIRDIHAVLTIPVSNNNLSNINGHATIWHTDYKNSFALMILLNDISKNDSHMEFILSEVYEPSQRINNLSIHNKKIKSCTGKAGTFFLFRNGHYLHRAKLLNGKQRKTLHAIYLPK